MAVNFGTSCFHLSAEILGGYSRSTTTACLSLHVTILYVLGLVRMLEHVVKTLVLVLERIKDDGREGEKEKERENSNLNLFLLYDGYKLGRISLLIWLSI